MNVRGSLLTVMRDQISKENGYLCQANVEKNSGNFYVMQRWSDKSGYEMRLPLGERQVKVGAAVQ